MPVSAALAAVVALASLTQDETLRLPPGFHISVFAQGTGLEGVRYLAVGPGGVLYAARTAAGVVVRLPDANGDHRADSAVTVLRGLDKPFGLAFRGETLYVAEERAVQRFDPGGTGGVPVVPRLPGGGGHYTRTIVFGSDGALYVSVGSSCNICDERDTMRASVMRFERDGSRGRVFARGLRNSVGLAVHPATGDLWASNNDRDNLGDDIPPERINILRSGGYYGWPECFLPGEANPEYRGADCSTVEAPAITFQAHSAPLGMGFYSGTAFPADYRGDLFVALHGSWNRSVPTGAKVIRVQVEHGRPVGIDDFVVGWQRPDGTRWGRPVSVATAPDGALFVSDDLGGKIWRVTYGR